MRRKILDKSASARNISSGAIAGLSIPVCFLRVRLDESNADIQENIRLPPPPPTLPSGEVYPVSPVEKTGRPVSYSEKPR